MPTAWHTFLMEPGATFDHGRVIHFGDLRRELQLAGSENIITDLSYKGLIDANGPDTAKFLQGQLTCDLNEISETSSRLSAYCNVKGRVLATFRLFFRQEHYYLSLPRKIVAPTLAQLQKHAVFSKVTLQEANPQFFGIGLSGPAARTILQKLFTRVPENIGDVIQEQHYTLIKIFGSLPRFEIYGDTAAMITLWKNLAKEATPAGADAWQLLNIMAGIPTIYPATIGRFTPHQINYPRLNGVSFKKGCYVGQETIARMEHLGKLKSHLYRCQVACTQIPKPGNDIIAIDSNQQAQPVGTVVIAKLDPIAGYQMLALLKDEFAKDDCCYLDFDRVAGIKVLPL